MGDPKPNPKKPYVSRELLAWLERIFPDRAPTRAASDREIWIAVGGVEVVKHLRAIHEAQETT